MNNSNRILLNTAVTYISLFIRLVIGLFTVRLVLQALGEEDYGVYVIVGGIVALLDILNSNMSNTSMRYLAYSLGNKDKNDIVITFNSTLIIHYLIGALSVVLLEVGGWIMLEYIVNIPPEKMADARIIYQFMVLTTFISIIAVPYDAVINAHEKIWYLSILDVVYGCVTLIIALFLLVFKGNRLVMYGLCLLLLQVLMRVIKVTFAKKYFPECRSFQRGRVNRERIKGILSFTGWNLFGSIAAVGAGQLRSLVINYFFGVRLNAAEGVARQVNKPLNMMVTSMTRAINPQIMKSEGGENRLRMQYIVEIGAKYSSFLFALFGIPVFIEAPFLFKIWLKDVPEFAVIFCQITIICALCEKFTFQLVHAVNAVGNIKGMQVSSAIVNLIYLPIAFVMFRLGYSPTTIYYLSFLSIIGNAIVRFYFGERVAGILPVHYLKNSVFPVLLPLLISFGLTIVLHLLLSSGFTRLVIVTLFFCFSFTTLFWFLGMTREEKKRWFGIAEQAIHRFRKQVL